jgi:hypothetical protein
VAQLHYETTQHRNHEDSGLSNDAAGVKTIFRRFAEHPGLLPERTGGNMTRPGIPIDPSSERGAALLITAVALASLILVAALVVDVANGTCTSVICKRRRTPQLLPVALSSSSSAATTPRFTKPSNNIQA